MPVQIFDGAWLEPAKRAVTDLIGRVAIAYLDYDHKEFYREDLGPTKSGETIDYTIPSWPGWAGLKRSTKLYRAALIYQTAEGEDLVWMEIGRVFSGTHINIITLRPEDITLN